MTSPLQQKLKITGPTAITANRLSDGVVVWLTPSHGWSTDIADAAIATTSDVAMTLLSVANGDEIHAVGAYPARVVVVNGRAAPVNLRERIRVGGPTIAFEARA
ncbi:DUF2849 domain-containing protein [Aquabacter spiritensis]|uniref:Uncharacterized protein DUF2849 n=1 Tax=Aquabacter spiritensis TaxID=933073 RepID=A0A4R3M7F0_9HYPH|nr:DUF2849 domain-containing protein [Aquabacter spiritensis]TCT08199.1 uncharacterized protein DUF2849 [Aquabacter spiritensis]